MASSNLRDLVELGRLRFLLGGLLLYLFGVQLALIDGATIDTLRLILGYVIVFGAHLSVSYSNDYFDYDGDHHSEPSPFSGGSGVLQRRPELRPAARAIALSLMGLSMAAAVVFVIVFAYPWWFLIVAAFCNLLGWFYSAPPLRLTQTPLGEIATALSVGLLVHVFGALVVAPSLSRSVLLFGPAMLSSGFVFILLVQIPDVEADAAAEKPTWVRSLGRGRAFAVLMALLAANTAYYIVLAATGSQQPVQFFVVALISLAPLLPAAVAVLRKMFDAESATKMVGAVMGASILVTVAFNVYLLVARVG